MQPGRSPGRPWLRCERPGQLAGGPLAASAALPLAAEALHAAHVLPDASGLAAARCRLAAAVARAAAAARLVLKRPLPLPLPWSHPAAAADAAAQAQALLSLPEAASNWDEATAALAGAPWQDGTDPCGSPPWKGVTCQDGSGRVTQLALPGLGLQGMLPANLSDLPFLEVLK